MESQSLETPDTATMKHLYDKTCCPQVAVIILNWNGAALLREYLPEVIANTPADLARVIVADNGSTDNSLQLLAEEFPGVEVLQFAENYGFAEGYNRALAATRYPVTVLLNSDAAPAPQWIEPLTSYLNEHPDVAAVQPKLLSRMEPQKFEYAGACGGFIDRNGYPYCRGRIFDVCEDDHGQYDTPCRIFWATGAALTVRTEVYLKCGGLDPKFFAHMEEIDLCWRIQLQGHKIAAVPQSVVYHLGGGSLPASNPRKTYLNFRNNLLMLHKNVPKSERCATLLRRRLLDTVAWAKFVLTGDWKNAAAVWRAHRDFARMRSEYPDADVSENLLRRSDCRRNILVNRYLRGRTHFSQLR